jgi:two-component system sensor histidine kinase PhoQ
MLSLSARLGIVAALVLAGFLGLTGLALDRAFRQSVEAAVHEGLQAHVYALLGAADVDGSGRLRMPEVFPEPRFSAPASGLYAAVAADGETLWRSPSSLGIEIAFPPAAKPGEPAEGVVVASDGATVDAMSYPVSWDLEPTGARTLVFQAALSRAGTEAQIAGFRRTLWSWLGAAGLFLLVAQTLVLRWSLGPLRRVARELREIENGERAQLADDYPRELRPLTRNVNALLTSASGRLQRYRDSLSDLAHSLKTPLAVLRASRDELPPATSGTLSSQVDRMDQAIAYHVQRAAAAGRTALMQPVDVADVLAPLTRSFEKVYREKNVALEVAIAPGAVFIGDSGDLTEILGNVLDNAYKWCRGRVRVRARNAAPDSSERAPLVLDVEDDGPGIAPLDREAVLERGVRADGVVPGQGIGLAVAREMVEEAYGGSLELSESELGGALLRIRI